MKKEVELIKARGPQRALRNHAAIGAGKCGNRPGNYFKRTNCAICWKACAEMCTRGIKFPLFVCYLCRTQDMRPSCSSSSKDPRATKPASAAATCAPRRSINCGRRPCGGSTLPCSPLAQTCQLRPPHPAYPNPAGSLCRPPASNRCPEARHLSALCCHWERDTGRQGCRRAPGWLQRPRPASR